MLGLNFSHREMLRLGLDPEEALSAILIHLNPALLRLSLYWDEIAPEPGGYDFAVPQAMLDRAQDHGCRVLLTIGFKPQRHPAFHAPRWLIGAGPDRLSANVHMMLERAVALLADYNTIDAWEVENLPFLPASRQPPGWSVGRQLLRRQIGVIRDVDSRHRPVVASHPGGHLLQRGWLEALTAADVLGCLLSFQSQPDSGFARLEAAAAERGLAWQLSIQAAVAARFGRPLWVTELIGDSEQDSKTDEVSLLERAVDLAQKAGAGRVYLRGAEQWLLMRSRGRPQRWLRAQSLLRSS